MSELEQLAKACACVSITELYELNGVWSKCSAYSLGKERGFTDGFNKAKEIYENKSKEES